MKAPLLIEMKGNSLDDGPGIRTVLFFKGCPLNCIWCHNPESKRAHAELSYSADDCIGCGSCIKVCKNNALSPDNDYFIDRDKCAFDLKCTTVCPTKAISVVGKEPDQEEILRKIIADKPFFDVSGGGVTLSGGEATLCTEWVGNLAKEIQAAGISVLLETCGLFDWDKFNEHLLPYVDDIYYDLKIFDRERHKKYCGAYNDIILDNFSRLAKLSKDGKFKLLPRTPLIPEIADTDDNLIAIADFVKACGIEKADVLAYNPTWYPKNHKLGIETAEELKALTEFQPKEKVEHCRQLFRDRGIEC